MLQDAEVNTPLRTIGIPREFLDHGKPADVRAAIGLSPSAVAQRVMTALHTTSAPPPAAEPAMVERSA